MSLQFIFQAKKPYDVRDVIEQCSQGHLNMMVRIKVWKIFLSVKCDVFIFLGVAETPGLHTGEARQLPAGGG